MNVSKPKRKKFDKYIFLLYNQVVIEHILLLTVETVRFVREWLSRFDLWFALSQNLNRVYPKQKTHIINCPFMGHFLCGDKMNLIYECAKKYEELTKYNYTLYLSCGLNIDLKFKPASFFHLMGLHKLTDIKQLTNSKNPTTAYKNILNGFINQSIIEKSMFYNQIQERLEKFLDIENIMKSKIIIDFDYRLTPGASSKLMSKYILFKAYKDTNAHLCFKLDTKSQNFYAPETFIIQPTDYYIKNQVVYDVVKITKTPFKTK